MKVKKLLDLIEREDEYGNSIGPSGSVGVQGSSLIGSNIEIPLAFRNEIESTVWDSEGKLVITFRNGKVLVCDVVSFGG